MHYIFFKTGYRGTNWHIWLANVRKKLLKRQNIVYFFTYEKNFYKILIEVLYIYPN